MNQSRQITEGALFAALYIALFVFFMFVPFLSTIALILLPFPFVLYASRYNWKPALLMFAVVLLITILITHFIMIPLVVVTALGGIMIGAAIHQKVSAYETWARGTAGFVVGFLFAYLFAVLVFDVNIMNQVDQFVNTANEQSKALLHQFGVSNIDQQIEIIEEQMMIMKHLIPMMLVAISIFFAFIVQWISYKLLNRIEKANYHFPPFRTLSFPTAIVWVYFVALLVSFFQTDKEGVLFLGAQNIMILAGLLMAIQGLSFVFFYCYEKKVSKAIPIVVVILTLIFSPLLLPFIRILGIIDIGFGLRNRITKK